MSREPRCSRARWLASPIWRQLARLCAQARVRTVAIVVLRYRTQKAHAPLTRVRRSHSPPQPRAHQRHSRDPRSATRSVAPRSACVPIRAASVHCIVATNQGGKKGTHVRVERVRRKEHKRTSRSVLRSVRAASERAT